MGPVPDRAKDAAPDPKPEGEEAEGGSLIQRLVTELELLARNVAVVETLSNRRPMGIIRLSDALHLPIHKTRYSLHLLEREGVIQPSADGAVVTEKARQFWRELDQGLERMGALIQHLRERAASHRNAERPK